ncbi:unnamed protein product [Alopecurus aequalis]
MFIVVMYYNDCPRNGNGADCMGQSVLRRFSFQPLKENPPLRPLLRHVSAPDFRLAVLVKYDGLDGYKVVHGNQAWRLETSTCLHAGLIYLGANMISLIFVGVRLEQQFGFCKADLWLVMWNQVKNWILRLPVAISVLCEMLCWGSYGLERDLLGQRGYWSSCSPRTGSGTTGSGTTGASWCWRRQREVLRFGDLAQAVGSWCWLEIELEVLAGGGLRGRNDWSGAFNQEQNPQSFSPPLFSSSAGRLFLLLNREEDILVAASFVLAFARAAEAMDVRKEPDAWDLFRHYDKLYFRGALVDAAFTLDYITPRTKTISAIGSCSFGKTIKTITLHRTNRTSDDLKNALLHLMIHAIIFVKHGTNSCSKHGPVFRDWMEAINTCSIEDCMRPKRGYCITTTHDFSPEEPCCIQGNLWKCESCGRTLVRATKLGPPSDSCCIENVSQHATCNNFLCHWHNHKMNCGGTYVVPGGRGQKMVRIGKRGLLTETSKSWKAVPESDSDEARAPGSSSSKKASKSNMPEDCQKAIVLPATPWKRLKPKQESVASEIPELFSMVSRNNAKSLGSCSSKKADGFQKAIVASASSPSKLKRKQASVALEKDELFSLRRSCKDEKPPRSTTSRNKKPEGVEKSSVPLAAPLKELKLEPGLVASEKHGDKPLGSSTGNKPAAPQSILKQQNKTNSSFKAGKQQHDPEDFRVTFSQPAVSQRKLKQSNLVTPKRPRTRSKTTSSPKKKQYACISVWAGIYESECSSGSDEPLINKRTERRKREREERERAAQIIYSQSKKRSASGISSIKAEPVEEGMSSQQTQSPSQRLEKVIVIDDADEVVTQDPRDQSKAPAPRVEIAAVPPADQVTTQTPGGQSQPPTQPMDIVIPPADLAMTQALRDPSSPFRRMDIAAVPPADQVMTQAPRGQSQPLPRRVDSRS